jgi:hypothetical protein
MGVEGGIYFLLSFNIKTVVNEGAYKAITITTKKNTRNTYEYFFSLE